MGQVEPVDYLHAGRAGPGVSGVGKACLGVSPSPVNHALLRILGGRRAGGAASPHILDSGITQALGTVDHQVIYGPLPRGPAASLNRMHRLLQLHRRGPLSAVTPKRPDRRKGPR